MDEETHIQRVLRREMEERGLNPHSMAKAAGLKPDAIRDLFRKSTNSPRSGTASALAAYLGISMEDLLGVPVRLGAENLKRRRPSGLPSDPALSVETDGIAEIDGLAGAGSGSDVVSETWDPDIGIVSADSIRDYWKLPDGYLRGELGMTTRRTRIIEVRGDSMMPTLRGGDRVMIDLLDRAPSPPGIFAIWDGVGLAIKRVEVVLGSDPITLRILSDNQAHTPETRAIDDLHVIGRVVWLARRV